MRLYKYVWWGCYVGGGKIWEGKWVLISVLVGCSACMKYNMYVCSESPIHMCKQEIKLEFNLIFSPSGIALMQCVH